MTNEHRVASLRAELAQTLYEASRVLGQGQPVASCLQLLQLAQRQAEAIATLQVVECGHGDGAAAEPTARDANAPPAVDSPDGVLPFEVTDEMMVSVLMAQAIREDSIRGLFPVFGVVQDFAGTRAQWPVVVIKHLPPSIRLRDGTCIVYHDGWWLNGLCRQSVSLTLAEARCSHEEVDEVYAAVLALRDVPRQKKRRMTDEEALEVLHRAKIRWPGLFA